MSLYDAGPSPAAEPFADLPQAMVREMLGSSRRLAGGLADDISSMRSMRSSVRESLAPLLGRDSDLPRPKSPPSTAGVDGSHCAERTYEKTGAGAGRSWEKTSGPAAPQAWVAICLARPRAQAPPPRASNGFAEGHAAALAAAANILLHYASSFFLARLRNLLSLRSYLGVLLCVYGLRLTST